MSSFTTLLLVVACAALLAGCEARQHRNRQHARPSRRNSNDATIILGSVGGFDIRALPILQLDGDANNNDIDSNTGNNNDINSVNDNSNTNDSGKENDNDNDNDNANDNDNDNDNANDDDNDNDNDN